ncbi:MAG TPA: radical SAM protein [Candidatus Omnitrophota bacterium]|nr:radical SAM protein [Candidatus Omnitrophota bacterium]
MKMMTLIKKLIKPGSRVSKAVSLPEPMLYGDYSCTMPYAYMIDTMNSCNLKCPYCPTGAGLDGPPRGRMGLGSYRTILEKIAPHARQLYLFNNGEPFLNPDIVPMVRLAAAKGIHTIISTNLTLPGIDLEAVASSGLSELIVSIDGASRETYEKYRIGGDHDRVMKNIRDLAMIKQWLGNRTPRIVWQFLVNRFNEHEIDQARRMAGEIGVEFLCKRMYVWDKDWETTLSEDSAGIAPTISHSEIPPYEKAGRELPMPIRKMVLHPHLYDVCRYPFTMLTIEWNGNVYPCCAAFDRKAALGNLLEQSLEEIWNGKPMRDCREYLFSFGNGEKEGSVCETIKCSLYQKHLKKGG